MVIQYCKDCGARLRWVEDEKTLERIGWKCPTCEKQWLDNDHVTDIVSLIQEVNNLKKRVKKLEEN